MTTKTNPDENYEVRRSLFTRQDAWIPQLLADDAVLGWFFIQFQSCFGRSASVDPNKPGDTQGIFLRYATMAKLMTEAGYKIDKSTFERHLGSLVKLGIVAKAKVTPHSRSRIIYLINADKPFQYQELAEQLAGKQRDKSPYKNQAKNSAAKKAREAAPVAATSSALVEGIKKVARIITSELPHKLPAAEKRVYTYLTQDENVFAAYRAVKDLVTSDMKLTDKTFEIGTVKNVPLSREEEQQLAQLRDYIIQLRLEVSQQEAQERSAELAEQSKAEAAQRKADWEAQKAAEAKLTELSPEEVQVKFEEMLEGLEVI